MKIDQPFDVSKALAQVGGDKAFHRELVEAFLVECPAMLEELDAAISRNDEVALRRVAHTLKGSADFMAAEPTKVAAMELENLGRSGQWDKVPEAVCALKDAVDKLLPKLRTLTES